jgi:uncharacterized protein YhhL (DUF1145 family)
MTDLTSSAFAAPIANAASRRLLAGLAAAKYHIAAFGLALLIALIYLFGYPLVISLALLATFLALAMLVGLTALDLVAAPKPRRRSQVRARRVPMA